MCSKRVYDPEVYAIASQFPQVDMANAQAARALFAALIEAAGDADPTLTDARVAQRELRIPRSDGSGEIPLRLYTPNDGTSGTRPAFVNFHGGAFILGDLETEHPRCLKVAGDCGAVAISVDYRLAPEHPFPAGVEDCYAAVEWTLAHAAELGIDPDRIVTGGGSAGGNLTAAVALMARDRKGPRLAGQMLIYPVIDDRCETESMRTGYDTPIWTTGYSLAMWNHYLGADRSQVSPYASPARATDLSGLPPAYVTTCEHDPLRDEALHYAMRLMHAGVPVELHNYAGTVHGFDLLAPSEVATRALEDFAAAFRRMTG